MAEVLDGALILLLLAIAGALVRVALGPDPADRMMGAQLVGTGGIGLLVLLAARMEQAAILDVALLLALLAAFASVAFVKSRSDAGDPESDPDGHE
jgi:multicomponent Na+:H+ antiporter subunit F